MSLKIEGVSCAKCKAYLFTDDDIVYCPVCGAPHHRECYNALGHCALDELHGTDQEYSREKVIEAQRKEELAAKKQEENINNAYTTCSMCGEPYLKGTPRCPKCATPNVARFSRVGEFDFLGGVPADYKLDDNVTAEDAKKFVVANTYRYIPKFATLSERKKLSWNWMAFLFPCEWMLSRKMFKSGIIAGIFVIIANLFTVPFSLEMQNFNIQQGTDLEYIIKNSPELSRAALLLLALGIIVNIVIRAVSALYGDYIYKNHTISSIKKIKAESEDIAMDYRKRGGVNLIWFLVASLALQYIPSILMSFYI